MPRGERRGTWRAAGALAASLAISLAACGEAEPPTAGDPECGHLGWRDPTPAPRVVCPGTADCLCADGDICCVAQDESLQIVAARCMPAEDCNELPIRCDGPEDCADDRVCCFRDRAAGGGACVRSGECAGDDDLTLCRSDGDCPAGLACVPAEPGTYFDAAAAFCRE